MAQASQREKSQRSEESRRVLSVASKCKVFKRAVSTTGPIVVKKKKHPLPLREHRRRVTQESPLEITVPEEEGHPY